MSELFTRSTTQNLADTVNKSPHKLSLWFRWPSTFLLYRIDIPRMEEIGTINPETTHCEFYVLVLHLCTTNHLYGFDLLVTRELARLFNVETVAIPKFIKIGLAILLIQPYKFLLLSQKIFMRLSFSSLTFIFIATFLMGLHELGLSNSKIWMLSQ